MPKPLNQTQLPRVRELFMVMPKLPANKQDFARSLQDSFRQYGSLTHNQMHWVEKLIDMANAPKEATANAPAEHSQKIPGFKAVEDLLYHAKQFHEFPVIRLLTEKGQRIKLRPRQTERAVKVQVEQFYGTCKDETLDMSKLRYLPDPTDMLNTLYEMAAHPVETAVLYGKRTGVCCFCGIGLTNHASLHAGYGPICAENYGLPWGDRPGKIVSAKTVEDLEKLL